MRQAAGIVFLAAGALKSYDLVQSVLAVGAYDLLPNRLALMAGLWVPGLEVAVGAALLTGFLDRGAALLGVLLSLAFLGFTVSATWRALDVACGCFGPLSFLVRVGWPTILIDLALLFVCVKQLRAGERVEGG